MNLKNANEVLRVDLNERECVRRKRFMHNNLNQSGMFDLLYFMKIYDKIPN